MNRTQLSQSGRRTGKTGSKDRNLDLSSWVRIGLLAKKPEVVFSNLLCHVNVENLRQAFRAIDGSKAVGIDGIRKSDYEKNLESNLENLVMRIHKGTYRPMAKREVLIPKANGKTRPIAIACFEDKIVEWSIGKILESIYEPIFIRNSFGFRPRKSADDAIRASHQILKDNKRPFVVEIDLKQFFNTVPHRKLMRLLQMRISDKRLLGLIARFLKAEILTSAGFTAKADIGTPQGSIMSPVLANIYLHYALDAWFVKNYGSKEAVVVRYADDAIFMFSKERAATDFLNALRERLGGHELELNEDKTSIINFEKGKGEIFNFLGFSFCWAKRKQGKDRLPLIVKTQMETLKRKILEFKGWVQSYRCKMKLKDLWKVVASKLRGHYNYYGYFCNRKRLFDFYSAALNLLFKWLNRRSQRKSFTRERFKRWVTNNPLPRPPTMSELKPLGWSPYVR